MEVSVKITYKNEKLKQLREAAGFSQSQLAEKSGVNFRVIQDYEQGQKDLNSARFKTLLRLSIALRCTLSDLITDEETSGLMDAYKEMEEKKMEIKVEFLGGQSRYGADAVNYMLAKVDAETELYSEILVPEDEEDESFGYDTLKEEIISQAKEKGVSVDKLHFWYD